MKYLSKVLCEIFTLSHNKQHLNPTRSNLPLCALQAVPRGVRSCGGSAGRADVHLQPAVQQLHPAAAAAGAATGQRGGEKGKLVGGTGQVRLPICDNNVIFKGW